VSLPKVVVLDYGSGNLRSAERALARAGAEVRVTADLVAASEADGLVVPGVGAFAACVEGIRAVGGDAVIAERVADGRPVLGICVGMQVLYEAGEEHGVRSLGLGLLPGEVLRIQGAAVLPHMGWNIVAAAPGSKLFAGVEAERFYFVHSYAAPARPGDTAAEHGSVFAAAVEEGPLSATQFHPEKSADAGARVLANWLGQL
jgi:imidazole glycerol-phosphate synthase subunit HisH